MITDGTSNTICFCEAPSEKAMYWAEPKDLEKEAFLGIGRGVHLDLHVAFCDGSVRQLPNQLDPETRQKLLSIADGEFVDVDAISKW